MFKNRDNIVNSVDLCKMVVVDKIICKVYNRFEGIYGRSLRCSTHI
mgnify:CR=1 FL=1